MPLGYKDQMMNKEQLVPAGIYSSFERWDIINKNNLSNASQFTITFTSTISCQASNVNSNNQGKAYY